MEKVLQQDYADYYESQHPIEIMIDNKGYHAVQWMLFFYSKEIRQLLRTHQLFREVVLTQSNKEGISLVMPMTHTIASGGEVVG